MDFQKILNEFKNSIEDLLVDHAEGSYGSIVKEFESFLDKSKEDFKRWGIAFAAGQLNAKELKHLLSGKKDLLALKSLKVIGSGQKTLDDIKDDFINLILNQIIKADKG